MKINLPVTQKEKPFPRGQYLVSKTDLKGALTYVNDAFLEISGFSKDELIGKNHNVVRHPDMPPQAFEDLWRTVKEGRPWRGLVKNRSKDGDHYWVDAFVVPILKNDQIDGYMSVRSEPSRASIQAAETLYARLRDNKSASLNTTPPLLKRISLKTRLSATMGFFGVLLVLLATLGLFGLSASNDDLRDAHHEQLKPSMAIAQMIQVMGDNRSQIMLALQHAPDSPFLKLHDHPVTLHIEATLKNREVIEGLREEYSKHKASPEEAELAKAFFEARDAFSKEGTGPARDALKAGEFQQANVLLLTKMNPLYKDVVAKGTQLQQYILKAGEKAYTEAESRYTLIRNISIGGTVLGLLLIVVSGVLLTRAIVDPIERAIRYFMRISQGVLTDEITADRLDETGRLINELACMQVNLKVMLDEIRTASNHIGNRCQHLEGEMNRVVSQSQEQRDRVQSVAATTEEFSQSVVEVAESAGTTADAAATSRRLVSDTTSSLSNSMQATNRVVESVQASSTSIDKLNESIQRIGEITNAIKEIADQTNLLALNAAIEAARAGEQGRGFAVVADEVRKLAERTTSSTTDISAMVNEFQHITADAVRSMEQAVTEVQDGIGMMRSSVDGLDQVRGSSEEVATMAQHIAEAARQQSVASEDVASTIDKVSSLIDQNTSVAMAAWQSVEQLSTTAAQMSSLVSRFELVKR